MALPNIFSGEVVNKLIERINHLSPSTAPTWGKMNVAQMLAHCNVTYEICIDDVHPHPGGFLKFILKNFVKNKVVGEKPFPKNSRTAPVFLVSAEQDFDKQKKRLIDYLRKTQELGEKHFDGKENPSFGKMNKTEWNNLFYKHLDHHLAQFGV